MNFVNPIRDQDRIDAMKKFLKSKSERNYILFMVGINTGLRISDILPLRVGDVNRRQYFVITEKKTDKRKHIQMTPLLRRELKKYVEGKEDDEYLFTSRQGVNRPIGRSMAYKILREAAEYVGLDSIGTHTLRKTFGYHFYQKYKDVVMLMEIFNHTEEKTTLRYIGVTQDALDQAMERFKGL
ncbi:site-specific integrase [Pseudogracilibacillus auburnensis]|uniref:Phage integrase family protein n=1 Tax=Pseudogracilibacillus auburnensis TaxID=1494959 RepID=A0A2V3W3X9_9BACI|nr:site-specific integrase [Pseudogracilibacillus auburnensis]PXW88802.1 phage integrase family protein [Pseudogracilibacillus auburnensis]